MKRINWHAVLAIPLMTVCLSACGENTVQPNKKSKKPSARQPLVNPQQPAKLFQHVNTRQ